MTAKDQVVTETEALRRHRHGGSAGKAVVGRTASWSRDLDGAVPAWAEGGWI